ncbi:MULTISPECIES: DUF4880 domain-containing protein [Cupriavidus]
MSAPDHTAAPDPAVIREAAGWLVCLHSGEASLADHEAFERWRRASPEHEQAWQRAEKLSAKFSAIAPALGVPVLTRRRAIHRRAVVKALAILGVAAPAGWLGTRLWQGEAGEVYRAAVGGHRRVALADRSVVQLNTATEVAVRYAEAARVLQLRQGEIYIETAADIQRPPRPFLVETRQGRLRALGTRFVVRELTQDGMDMTALTVLEHRVEITLKSNGASRIVGAGETALFSDRAFAAAAPGQPSAAAPGWTRGMLQADNMRLDALLQDLARYRPGIIRCEPDVAGLRVSGVFVLGDTDHILDIIGETLPVRIVRRTAYWVTVAARTP